MRVLHLNTEKTWRGGERQTLITALEMHQRGFATAIGCRRSSPLAEAAGRAGVPVVPLAANALGALLGIRRAVRGYDLVHAHSGKAHSLAALAMRGGRQPLVVSRRVDFVPEPTAFNRFKYRRANRVVCVSRCIAALLREWGIPAEQLEVIYEAVPGDTYASRAEARGELLRHIALPPDSVWVGNIAALVPHKDHATLLRAARAVVDERPEVGFVIVGEGELRDDLLRLRAELRLAGRVFFTGFLPQAQRLLSAFDLFAMSSCMEGLGTIVLDAGMAGVPVVATAAGGLPELVLHEQTGLLAPVGDGPALARALLRLLADPGAAQRYATASRVRLRQEFSVSQMVDHHVQLYRQLLGASA